MKTFLYFVRGLFAIPVYPAPLSWPRWRADKLPAPLPISPAQSSPAQPLRSRTLATGAARTTHSGSTGAYLVSGLEPASYQITSDFRAFKPFNATAEVTVGGHTTVDARLSVNSETTEVQVVGEGGVAVNTQSQELSQVVDTTQLAHLPSLTRNPYDFRAHCPGTSAAGTTPRTV
jgi:hypothetical protein